MTDIEYGNLTAKEKEKYFKNMTEIEKYEDLKVRNKKYLSEEEKLFLLKMEVNLFENKVKENREKNKKVWVKNILDPVKNILTEIYLKNYSEFTDKSDLDERLSAYLIKILEDPNLDQEIKNINPEEYIFKNYKNIFARKSTKKTRKLINKENPGENNE